MPGKTSVFTYDAVGNRLSLTEEYAEGKTFIDPALDSEETNVIQYKKKIVAYTYSDRNELLSVTESMYGSKYRG